MFGAVRALNVPLSDHICVHFTRSETFDVALTQVIAGDGAPIVHLHIHLADLFGSVVTPLSAFCSAGRQIAARDLTVVAAETTAVVRFRTLERAVVPANGAATVARARALDITPVALTVDDALIEPFAAAIVSATGAAASGRHKRKAEEKKVRKRQRSRSV